MATKLTVMGAQCTTNAAAVAAAMAGGVTTADVTALGEILKNLGISQDLYIPLAALASAALSTTYPPPG